jgi:hypothetical protein
MLLLAETGFSQNMPLFLCRVLEKKEKGVYELCFGVYLTSADLPLTHHMPPFSPYFAVTPHLPHRQPACLTGSFALPIEQKKPPVRGEPRKVGHLPQRHIFMFSGVFGTTTPVLVTFYKFAI